MSHEIVRDGSSWHYDGFGNVVPDEVDTFGNRVENVDHEYDGIGEEMYSTDDFGNAIVTDEDLEAYP